MPRACNYIYVFWFLLFTLSSLLFTPANAQTKFLETQSFTAGLSTAASNGKILESVAGEISGSTIAASGKKILSGHSRTSHSPGVIYDLIASTGAAIGEGVVKCTWTHVGLDGYLGTASFVELKVATFPVTYANYSSITSSLALTALSTGTPDWSTYSHLVPGPTYYVALRVRDSANMYGRISANTTFFTYAILPDPVNSLTVVSSTYGAITLSWNVTGDDASSGDIDPGFFRIDYSSEPAHSFSSATYMVQFGTVAGAGTGHFYPLSNLLGNVTYYTSIYIGDDVTVYSGLGNIGGILTMSYPPTLTGFSNMTSNSFTVNFNANNAPGTQYFVQVSSYADFLVAISSGWLSDTSVEFSDLETNMVYYVRGKSRNMNNIETLYSDMGSISLTLNVAKPKPPFVRGSTSDNNFTITWDQVFYDIYGGTTSIKNYEVYRSTSISGVASLIASPSSATFSYTEAISGTMWYFVKSADKYNLKSENSLWLRNSGEIQRTVADDARAVIDLSPELASELNAAGLIPVIARQSQYESGIVLAAYKISLRDFYNNELANRDFSRSVMLIMPLSKTGSVTIDSISPSVSYSDYDYAVYYYNGVEDVHIGGTADPSAGSISVQTRKSGVFKVRRVIRSAGFRIKQTVPKKIFTPNGDSIWDEFHIIYDNTAAGLSIGDAKVYALDGSEIGKLKPGTYDSENSLMWDGKDKDGKVAKSGIYIYQFKAGDKYYNGTMVLAK